MTTGGDRYRADGGAATDGELRVAGQRVQQAIGRAEVTVAWSRNIRYSSKKRGYHGGASPLEIVSPLAILLRRLKFEVQHRLVAKEALVGRFVSMSFPRSVV